MQNPSTGPAGTKRPSSAKSPARNAAARTTSKAAKKASARTKADEARRGVYRQLIVEAAEAVFARHGFADAKMSDIALEAGVGLKTLYAAFDGKTALYDSIHLQRCEELKAISEACAGDSALDVVMEHIRVTATYLLRHPSFLRMHLRDGNAWAVSPPGGREVEVGPWEENMRHGTELIRRGIEDGVFVDEDPELLTKLVTALYQVDLADWIERHGDASSEQLIERVQRRARRILLRDPTA